MVYYLTSVNIKLLRRICEDYEMCARGAGCGTSGGGGGGEESGPTAEPCTPFEYMKKYVQQCPDSVSEEKLTWIAETFLSLQRHGSFLRELCSAVRVDLSPSDIDHLAIVLHSVIFQGLQPSEREHLYRAIFNLSKDLLRHFCTVFSNSEILPFVTQLAARHYDAEFVADAVVEPLFQWLPYIGEMAHDFDTYSHRMQLRSTRSPTVPRAPSALVRPARAVRAAPPTPVSLVPPTSAPSTPRHHDSQRSPRRVKMLTKSSIDMRLKMISQQNKQRATQLLNKVMTQDFNYARPKSTKAVSESPTPPPPSKPALLTRRKSFTKKSVAPPLPPPPAPPVKDTITSLKRMSKNVERTERAETRWLEDVMKSCRDTVRLEMDLEKDREEKENERRARIERSRLQGQISFEEAILAKQSVTEGNRRKYERFSAEKEEWIRQIEDWRKAEMQKAREAVEKLAMLELEVAAARGGVAARKRSAAKSVKQRTERLVAAAMRERAEELERRASAMKELKVLALVAREAALPRILDLTETSGLGLMTEMSLAELRERLATTKLQFREQLEAKRQNIKNGREREKRELEDTRLVIEQFLAERAATKVAQASSKAGSGDVVAATPAQLDQEILELREKLQNKRRLRQKIVASKKF